MKKIIMVGMIIVLIILTGCEVELPPELEETCIECETEPEEQTKLKVSDAPEWKLVNERPNNYNFRYIVNDTDWARIMWDNENATGNITVRLNKNYCYLKSIDKEHIYYRCGDLSKEDIIKEDCRVWINKDGNLQWETELCDLK